MNHKQTRRDRLAYRRELQRRQREALPTIALTAFAVGMFAGYGWAAQAYGTSIARFRHRLDPPIAHDARRQLPTVPTTGEETGL